MARSDNAARERRILDAAAELFVHYGYDKTTVGDIAREAGVSKGAIYLHFKSKDDLFEGLLLREMTTFAEKWLALIEADPRGGTMAGMYKNMLYALDSSAFMAVLFKQDGRVLGTYLRKPGTLFRDKARPSTRHEVVKLLQEAGAVRKDVDAKVVAHIMNMLAYGLVAMDEIMDRADMPSTADVIEGIAEIMDRALTPEGGGDSEAGKAVIRQMFEASRRRFEDDPRSKQEGEAP